MQDFFAQYGLWILIFLLVVVIAMYFMGGKKDAPGTTDEVESVPVVPIVLHAPDMAPATMLPEVQHPELVAEDAFGEALVAAKTQEPQPQAAPKTPATTGAADNLLLIKGIGPKLNILLGELGVTSYAQIAGWSATDIAAIDEKLGNFKGRPQRDNWVDQAGYLAKGDTAGFEAKYGKL